jgi:hypothetical protein
MAQTSRQVENVETITTNMAAVGKVVEISSSHPGRIITFMKDVFPNIQIRLPNDTTYTEAIFFVNFQVNIITLASILC